MKTEIIRDPDPASIERAGRIIRAGGLVAFPTETVYGLGGDAMNPEASRKIYAAKGRPSDNPLIIHISKISDLTAVTTDIPETAWSLAERFWPGPLTMILKKNSSVPPETTGGLETAAVRFPDNRIAASFIEASGGFVAAPSANLSGRPSPTDIRYVIEDLDGKVDMIIDGGRSRIGLESTILDLTEEEPVILRPGFVTSEMLSEVLEKVSLDPGLSSEDPDFRPKAPGMKYRHYAPKGDLTVVYGSPENVVKYINEQSSLMRERGLRTGVIASGPDTGKYRADSVKNAGDRHRPSDISSALYRILREFDDEETDEIYSEAFDGPGLYCAVMNRLLKAAGHKTVNADMLVKEAP